MTYPSNDLVQIALIARLKASNSIVVAVTADEVREDQWQGTAFIYPNIRVQIKDNRPDRGADCNKATVDVSFLVHTEDDTSRHADRIAGIINVVLHDISFLQSGLRFTLHTTNLVPAIRSDTRTWTAEVRMSGTVSG